MRLPGQTRLKMTLNLCMYKTFVVHTMHEYVLAHSWCLNCCLDHFACMSHAQ